MTLDGLSKADSSAVELVPGPFTGATDASNFVKTVQVPAGSPLAKFSVFSSDPNADFDMWVETPTGVLTVATSSASESASVPNPAPGTYTIYANLYASPNGQSTKASVDASVLVPSVGNASLNPNPLRLANGKTGAVTLNWKNLAAGSYIGRVTFAGASDPTFVSVLVTPAGTVVVPPTSEDPDCNDGPGESGDGGNHDGKDKKDKKDKGKKVKKEKGKIQNQRSEPRPEQLHLGRSPSTTRRQWPAASTAGHCRFRRVPPGRRAPHRCPSSRAPGQMAPATPPSSGAIARQRAISQPSVRLNSLCTSRPRNQPVTTATCGPPYCCVHIFGGPGLGKKISSPSRSTASRAAAGSGRVDPAVAAPPLASSRKLYSGPPGSLGQADGELDVVPIGHVLGIGHCGPSGLLLVVSAWSGCARACSSRWRSSCDSAAKDRWCSTYSALPSGVSIRMGG